MARMYFDGDADLRHLDAREVCIVGYGNQGRSQALNLRDSGVGVIVGSRRDRSYETALADGFDVFPVAETVGKAQVVFFLVPDEVMPDVFERDIAPGLRRDDMLVFASGYNIAFDLITPPADVDVVLIAPRMIGSGVRETFISGEGFPSLIAVHQDASGLARQRTLALCKGIGSTTMGVIESSFSRRQRSTCSPSRSGICTRCGATARCWSRPGAARRWPCSSSTRRARVSKPPRHTVTLAFGTR